MVLLLEEARRHWKKNYSILLFFSFIMKIPKIRVAICPGLADNLKADDTSLKFAVKELTYHTISHC